MIEEKAIPAQIPVKCVVCNGFGTVSSAKKVCHACDGKGYILVEAKRKGEEENE